MSAFLSTRLPASTRIVSAAIAGFLLLAVAPALAGDLLSASQAQQRGARVPWVSYEAEHGTARNGAKVVGPGRKLGTPDGEASGRMAVVLDVTGASIEWTAQAAANSIVVRNSIPDSPDGKGMEATLSLYVNGAKKASLKLSSVHSWLYGDDATQTDNPANGPPRKIYGETALLFKDFSIRQGDVVMLRKEAGDAAARYAIDFIDLEQVAPPLPKPEGYVSITDPGPTWKGAIPDDGMVDDEAINQCIGAARDGKYKGVYIPPGVFLQANKYHVRNVKIQGAGMWHSRIYNPDRSEDPGPGRTGFVVTGDASEFRDFAVFGWGGTRTQGGKAWVGSAFRNTVLERIWVENVHCGYWVGGPQESTNLLIKDCRFRNTGADAVNLCNGNLGGLVVNCHARNTGDDAFAIWSARDLYGQPCVNNVIRDCTVQITWRAACFAIYGGRGNRIENCLGSDALTYPGLTVSSEHMPHALESATIDGLTLNRCGATYWDPNQQFGAIWLFSADAGFAGVAIRNATLVDPTYQGIHLQSRNGHAMGGVLLENITIRKPTTFGIQVKAGALGTATFRGIDVFAASPGMGLVNQAGAGFKAVNEGVTVQGLGNAGPNALRVGPRGRVTASPAMAFDAAGRRLESPGSRLPVLGLGHGGPIRP